MYTWLKQIFAVILVVFCCLNSALAQQPSTDTAARKGTYKDGVARLNGQLIIIEKGVQKPLTKTVTMQNGTTVSPSGLVTIPGKKATQLKEGMAVNKQGRVVIFRDDMFTPDVISNTSEEVGYDQNTIIYDSPDTVIIQKK